MEETLQQETQESEYKNPNEDQGGIRRRLRDRDLLRKRKAEAEEKETNQWVLGVERQRKRPRADGGMKRRGRPRKSEPPPEISVILEEAENPPDAPAVVVVPEPAEFIPDQTPGSLTPSLAVEPQPPTVLATPAPPLVFGSIQSPIFAPTLTSPAFVDPTPASFSPSALAPSLAAALDMAPIPVQESPVQDSAPAPAPDTVPAPAVTQAPVPAADPAPPTAPPQVTFYSESQGREPLAPVLIEDLGPDEEEDIAPSQDKKADEELTETPLINVSEQNETFSTLTLTSTPPPQRYFPGF
ncbi:hemogen isoform X1 [Epinephelus lanceolatus]|uniref:actin cytoskeleton-regulatory complex protein PAN1 isoform X1 n=1 Tax=Epinephelus lanceolatus TaxID=310571 RepID=UPI001447BE9D|nr:actin cytoskeleton-regulatory complex protein PAN1 isoform X1 [Epinephelus lanceolatus]